MDKKRLLRVAVASVMALSVVASASVSLGNDAVLTVNAATSSSNIKTATSINDLVTYLKLTESDVTIKLGADLSCTDDQTDRPYGIEIPSTFTGTIDLNGYDLTISTSEDGYDRSMYGLTVNGVLKLTDSSANKTGFVKATITNKKTLVIDTNVTGDVYSTSTAASGTSENYKSAVAANLTINSGTITGNVMSASNGVTDHKVEINNGTFKDYVVDADFYESGGSISYVTVNGGVFYGPLLFNGNVTNNAFALCYYPDPNDSYNDVYVIYIGSQDVILKNMSSLGEFVADNYASINVYENNDNLDLSTVKGIENVGVWNHDIGSIVTVKGAPLKDIEVGDTELPMIFNESSGQYDYLEINPLPTDVTSSSPSVYDAVTVTSSSDVNVATISDNAYINADATGSTTISTTYIEYKLSGSSTSGYSYVPETGAVVTKHALNVVDVKEIKIDSTFEVPQSGWAEFLEPTQGKIRSYEIFNSVGTLIDRGTIDDDLEVDDGLLNNNNYTANYFYYDFYYNELYTDINDTKETYTIKVHNTTDWSDANAKSVTIKIVPFALTDETISNAKSIEVGDTILVESNSWIDAYTCYSNTNTWVDGENSGKYIDINYAGSGTYEITALKATSSPVQVIFADDYGNESTLNVTVIDPVALTVNKNSETVTAGNTLTIEPTTGKIRDFEVYRLTSTSAIPTTDLVEFATPYSGDEDGSLVYESTDGSITVIKYADGCISIIPNEYDENDSGDNTYAFKLYNNSNKQDAVDVKVKVNPFALKESTKSLEEQDKCYIEVNAGNGYADVDNYTYEVISQTNLSGVEIPYDESDTGLNSLQVISIDTTSVKVDLKDHEGNDIIDEYYGTPAYEFVNVYRITAVNPGTVEIKVTDSNGNSAILTVNVSAQESLKIVESETGLNVVEGQSGRLTVTNGVIRDAIITDTASEKDTIPSSKGIIGNLDITKGTFDALTPGTVYVKAYNTTNTEGATPVVVKVTVSNYEIINLENKSKLYVGDTFQLESNSQILGCTSDDTSVATVTADGKITAVGEGIANITIRDTVAETSKTNTYTITVMVVNPVEISFKQSSYETEVDKEVKVEINAGATVSEWKVLDENGKTVTGAIVESDSTSATIKVSEVGEYNISATNGLGVDSTVPLTVVEATTTDDTTVTEEPDVSTTEKPGDTTTTPSPSKPDDTTTTTEVTDTPINPEPTDRELARLVLIKKQVLGVSPIDLTTGDVNEDGQVNVIDVMARKNELIARGYKIGD